MPTPFRTILNSSFFLSIIFVGALFILIFISGISYRYTTTLTDSSALVVHSYKIRIELEKLISCLKDAESGQRGFILTGDSLFLKPLTSAPARIDQSFLALRELTKENTQQLLNLDSLNKLIRLRFDILSNSLKHQTSESPEPDRLRESLLRGEQTTTLVRELVNDMIDFELMYLKVHQDLYEHEISLSPLYTLLILLFSSLVFIFAYFKINQDIKKLKTSNEELSIAHEAINHAEEIGEFSSWQWHLESNEFKYSDNQYRLLGHEPRAFESSMLKFLEFVHPADRHILMDIGEKIIHEKEAGPITVFFRVIRKDGALRYFKSMGKLFTDANQKKIIIGIHWDITDQHLNRLSLEERNRELEQSNTELATFNHIASHDLQEPLRIIQTYISRISEKEMNTMSETTKGYMIRIQASIARLRILINDLLLYSRTNKGERVFEPADLNELLENARLEMAQAMEDKKATLLSDSLPRLTVIPFQIQQLFINLISNSLKFSQPGRPPVIRITADQVVYPQQGVPPVSIPKTFARISISDNGMGFEPQYAENIFILFHRLHMKNEYPGSGIGLSICKKIVENHGGYITAQGMPGIGATFQVFLPI